MFVSKNIIILITFLVTICNNFFFKNLIYVKIIKIIVVGPEVCPFSKSWVWLFCIFLTKDSLLYFRYLFVRLIRKLFNFFVVEDIFRGNHVFDYISCIIAEIRAITLLIIVKLMPFNECMVSVYCEVCFHLLAYANIYTIFIILYDQCLTLLTALLPALIV